MKTYPSFYWSDFTSPEELISVAVPYNLVEFCTQGVTKTLLKAGNRADPAKVDGGYSFAELLFLKRLKLDIFEAW